MLYREIDGEGILFDPHTNAVYLLNVTTNLIWKCCDGLHSSDDIVQKILARYLVGEDRAREDVHRVMDRFRPYSPL